MNLLTNHRTLPHLEPFSKFSAFMEIFILTTCYKIFLAFVMNVKKIVLKYPEGSLPVKCVKTINLSWSANKKFFSAGCYA